LTNEPGNSHARRVLIEAAWAYRFPARVARELQVRNETQPKVLREIAWRAQLRLCQRLHSMWAHCEKAFGLLTQSF
jgi:transposase